MIEVKTEWKLWKHNAVYSSLSVDQGTMSKNQVLFIFMGLCMCVMCIFIASINFCLKFPFFYLFVCCFAFIDVDQDGIVYMICGRVV